LKHDAIRSAASRWLDKKRVGQVDRAMCNEFAFICWFVVSVTAIARVALDSVVPLLTILSGTSSTLSVAGDKQLPAVLEHLQVKLARLLTGPMSKIHRHLDQRGSLKIDCTSLVFSLRSFNREHRNSLQSRNWADRHTPHLSCAWIKLEPHHAARLRLLKLDVGLCNICD